MKASPLAFALTLGISSACSVINSFDDVNPGVEGGAGSSGTGGSGGTSSAGKGGSSGSSATGGGGTTDGGGSGGDASAPPGDGLIVMAAHTPQGVTPPKDYVITLSPWTGKELHRDELAALGIHYEPVHDKWFVFKAGATPTDLATLLVGTYDLGTGMFTQLSQVSVPAPTGQPTITVLRDRIFYRSVVGGMNGVTVIDTTDFANLTVTTSSAGTNQTALPTGDFVRAIAHPSTVAAGGSVTLVQFDPTSNECVLDATGIYYCPVKVLTATIPPTGDPTYESTPTVISTVQRQGGGAAFTLDRSTKNDVDVLPPKDFTVDDTGQIEERAVFGHAVQKTVGFHVQGKNMSSATFDPCRNIVLSIETVTNSLLALPLTDGGNPAIQLLTVPALRVLYEPYTHTAIVPGTDLVKPDLHGYVLEGSDLAPAFKVRTTTQALLPWDPPLDVVPGIIAVKDPPTPPCQ